MANGYDPASFMQFRTQLRHRPEDIWQPVYDVVQYPAAGSTTALSFFATPLGGSATLNLFGATAGLMASASRTKTRLFTNLETSSTITTKAFQIRGISISFAGLDYRPAQTNHDTQAQDKAVIVHGSWIEIRIVDKPYLQLPTVCIPEIGMSPQAWASTRNAIDVYGAYNMGVGHSGAFWLPVPLTLDPYQNFAVSLTADGGPAITAATNVMIVLWGFMRRPGQ